MKQAILGAGGVGGLIAAALAHAGDDVMVVVRPASLAGYPRRLSLESAFGSFSVPVTPVSEVTEPVDVLWVAVKATQLEAALSAIPDPRHIGAIVPLLNGIDHVAYLRDRFGDERVVPATIAVESERTAPGTIVHRSPFATLTVSDRGEQRLRASLDELGRLGMTIRTVDDEATLLWSKLVFLAPLALTTSAARMPIGEILGASTWRTRLDAAVLEACAVASADGARVDAAAVTEALHRLPAGMRSSMQKDLDAGKPLELDAIASPIIVCGAQREIHVPVTRELVALVEAQARA